MGNYLTVKCSNCSKEVTAEFREDLLQPQMIEIEKCAECAYDEGQSDGYDNGFPDGRDDAYKKILDFIKEER